jgi:predicted glutamate--cysteine ligase
VPNGFVSPSSSHKTSASLLTKGFEVEMYTGTPEGEVVGFSDKVVAAMSGFAKEPDARNVEYITDPLRRYEDLLCALVRPRIQLRQFLRQFGPYTLLPGSTLALGGSQVFQRSDPTHPYHTYIEQTYGTSVVTASIHINLGLPDQEAIFRACRLLRAEAPLYLALSASSPFLDGRVSGSHSRRWQVFPKTPTVVPYFVDQQHYIQWTAEQLQQGTMQNVRHLWCSVRPNGPDRPHLLNRVEVRICDLVADPVVILAIAAFIEARLHQMLADPQRWDPLHGAFTPDELVEIEQVNEQAAARSSLEATLIHWQTGESLTAQDWIDRQLATAWVESHAKGFSCFLAPIQRVLDQGNEAQRWLRQVAQGSSPAEVYRQAIGDLAHLDHELQTSLCQPLMV